MEWDQAARATLAQLIGMVPVTFRELAEASAREEAEAFAAERGAASVSGEDVVRAWIDVTPPDQRDGLVAVIEQLGYEPESFADELSAEAPDWEEPPDPGR